MNAQPSNTAATVRHALTFLGGILAARGVGSDEEIQAVIGALMTLGAFAWSLYQKHQVRRALAPTPQPEPTQPEP